MKFKINSDRGIYRSGLPRCQYHKNRYMKCERKRLSRARRSFYGVQIFRKWKFSVSKTHKNEVDLKTLLEKSRKYDLKERANNFISYIKSGGKVKKCPLPDFKDFLKKAELYSVKLN